MLLLGALATSVFATDGTARGQQRPRGTVRATAAMRAARNRATVTQPAPAAPPVATSLSCPSGMNLVEGEYCTNVDQRCLRWLDETRMRCAEFAPPRCTGRRRHIAACVDRYDSQPARREPDGDGELARGAAALPGAEQAALHAVRVDLRVRGAGDEPLPLRALPRRDGVPHRPPDHAAGPRAPGQPLDERRRERAALRGRPPRARWRAARAGRASTT